MQQHQRREECIEMHVEAIAPLNVRLTIPFTQVSIGEKPRERRCQYADYYNIHNNDIQNTVNGLGKCKIKRPCESNRRNCNERNHLIFHTSWNSQQREC